MSNVMTNVNVSLALSAYRITKTKQKILAILVESENISDEEKQEAEHDILVGTSNLISPKKHEDDLVCSICLSIIGNETGMLLECGHIFHESCHNIWISDPLHDFCALCKDYFEIEFILERIWTRLTARLTIKERKDILR